MWRVALFLFLLLAIKTFPLQQHFLGGGMANYLANPFLWAWANFDGEHYLAISQFGYQPLTYFFFPLYPLLIKAFGGTALVGVIISNLSLLVALVGLWRLVRFDFGKEVARMAVWLVLLFPTSFYFGSVYTESLFLALTVWFFYFLRKRKWLLVVVLGGLASATRLVGAALLAPWGLVGYALFLQQKTGDALAFMHQVGIFGGQRSESLVLLPQVFYRYFFKVLPNLNLNYFPSSFVGLLEIGCALGFLVLIVVAFKKLRLEYALYALAAYLVPTLSGSFSSLPRYVLIIFPAFIVGAIYLKRLPRVWQILVFAVLFIMLGMATMLFTRGYWVA